MEIPVHFMPEAEQFLDDLREKERIKILADIRKTRIGLRGEWFKKMKGTDDIWEFRTLFNKTYYRMFAFWHRKGNKETLIICTHGLIKKTDKTPLNEILKAEQLKKKFIQGG